MNLIAIDIGNTKIKVAFYLNDEEKLIKSVDGNAGDVQSQLADILTECWDQAPLVKSAKEPVKECATSCPNVIISKPCLSSHVISPASSLNISRWIMFFSLVIYSAYITPSLIPLIPSILVSY